MEAEIPSTRKQLAIKDRYGKSNEKSITALASINKLQGIKQNDNLLSVSEHSYNYDTLR